MKLTPDERAWVNAQLDPSDPIRMAEADRVARRNAISFDPQPKEPAMTELSIELGDVVKDPITGFTGVVTAYTRYLYGQSRVGVESMVLIEGKPVEPQYFDVARLQRVVTKP